MPAVIRIAQKRAEHAERTRNAFRRFIADGALDDQEARQLDRMLATIVRGHEEQIVEIGIVTAYLAGGEPARQSSNSRVTQLQREARRSNVVTLPMREEVNGPDEAA